jgi:hyperosmotically inducible protein
MDSAVALDRNYRRCNMDSMNKRHTAIAAAVLLALGIVACSETETTSGGTVTVVKPTEQTAGGPVMTPTEPQASTTATPTEQLATATAPANPEKDAAITASVKAELAKEPEMSSQNIQVATVDSVVTLSGQVDDPAKIDRAKFLAQSVEGIADVNNELVATSTG